MTDIKPFSIHIPDPALADLQQRLALTRFPDELDGAGWEYGAPLADVRRLVARWRNGYDWRAHESALNAELPMFTTDVETSEFGTLNMHFVHQESKVKEAIPLLFVHGWPGSFLEVQKILPLLTEANSESPSFHVVAVSLPGFGFSEAPRKPGFTARHYGEVCHKVMLKLGYNEYVTQGGDWGYTVTRCMAHDYGTKHVKAWHTNHSFETRPKLLRNPLAFLSHYLLPYSAEEKEGLKRTADFYKNGTGYDWLHRTKPQTAGYALADSPAGLLAWIYEKLVGWVDGYPWTDDEVLTWISVYWFSRAGPAASIRIYKEILSRPRDEFHPRPFGVPMGISYFPGEIYLAPSRWMHTAGSVVFENRHDKGGHFASHEQPEKLVADLRTMFGRGGAAFSVVPEKNGYTKH